MRKSEKIYLILQAAKRLLDYLRGRK